MKTGTEKIYIVDGRTFKVERKRRLFSRGCYYSVHAIQSNGTLEYYGAFFTISSFKECAVSKDWFWSRI